MKNYRTHVGIDVSKLTLDYCLLQEDQKLVRGQILNTQKSVKTFLKALEKEGFHLEEALFVFENTGIYSSILSLVLSESVLDYAQVPALEIKRSLGITRGKSDKVDAKEIAQYAKRNTDKITLSTLPELSYNNLKWYFLNVKKPLLPLKFLKEPWKTKCFSAKKFSAL